MNDQTSKDPTPNRSNGSGDASGSDAIRDAKFSLGQAVKHRFHPFRGVVFDVDPVFANSEEWWLAIPANMRPAKDQPYYHLLAENEQTTYVAYVSEQNLLADPSDKPIRHPQLRNLFGSLRGGFYEIRRRAAH